MGVLGHAVLDLIWLLFLLGMLFYFWQERRHLKKSLQWPQTIGQITQFNWTKEGHQLWPKITYAYWVNEREYIGESLLLKSAHTTFSSVHARKVAYRAAMAFERNETVEVYYNPEAPEQAVLDIEMPKKLNVIILLLLFFIALHLTIVGYRWLS